MRTKTFQLMLTALLALVLTGSASAQDAVNFVVDGDLREWGVGRFDGRHDVVPDTNSTVDIRGFEFCGSCPFHLNGISEAPDTLFAFFLRFLAPPFQDAEETTVELFFDVSVGATYGAPQPSWTDFRPDYVFGVTGKDGALTKEFYWRHTGSEWVKKEGADIAELEVALSGKYLEGAVDWKLLDVPDTDLPIKEIEMFNQKKAVQVSKGAFRDYVPDSGQPPLDGSIFSFNTNVEPASWGRIKAR